MLTAIEPLSLPSVVGSKALFGNSNNPEHSGGAAKPQGNTDFDYLTKVQRADLMCDVIKKLAPFVLSKL